MTTDVLEYLHSKNLSPKRAGGSEVHVPCPFCGEDDRKRGRLYVNVDTGADIPGLFHCKLCDAHGALVSLQRHYGDVTEEQEKADDGYLRRAILAEAASYYYQALADHDAAVRWLTHERGLKVETITDFQLGYADGGLFKHLRASGFPIDAIAATGLTRTERDTGRTIDFLHNHITIPYTVAGNVVMIRGRAFGESDDGRKYVTPPGQKTRLFNSDATWEAEEICITEGEFDALVLHQLGYRVVACPGANVWQDAWDGYFTRARRVWVLFDRDEQRQTGHEGATKVLTHLGAKARQVELPPHDHGKAKNDITEYVVVCGHTKADLDELMRACRGYLISVDEAIKEHTHMAGLAGLRFGIGKLDELLFPGLRQSQLMVVLAKTGSGKTVGLLNMFQTICDLQPELKILFLSLEQTRADWWERARRIFRFYNPGTTDRDAAAWWRERIWLDDRNRVSEEHLRAVLDDFAYEVGRPPDLLAVDYLGYFARSFKGENYQRTGDAVMALKGLAKDYGIPIISPHQVSRTTKHGSAPSLDSARDSGVVEETADFVLSLWSQDTEHGRSVQDRTGETLLRIAKSRHGSVGHTETLWFGYRNLALISTFPPDGTPGGERGHNQRKEWAKDEVEFTKQYSKEQWEHALVRHMAKGLAYQRKGYSCTVDADTPFEYAQSALLSTSNLPSDLEMELKAL